MGIFNSAYILMLYSFAIIPSIFTLKKSANVGQINSKPLNECLRCKLLTDSFTYWLGKTSRGKHEGGDVAWEEAKLKSYARSEMRLVDIQESLCSELKKHQDSCYALAEEAEQLLETWWFDIDQDSLDLYTWLCIEQLQQCCPANHYGNMCTPCFQDNDSKICSGNGKCNGDGTREGDGKCICKPGFAGTICNKCASNYFRTSSGLCKPCHRSCNGCHGDTIDACLKCATGWNMELSKCVDVDECLNQSTCRDNEFCTNNEGSYTCKSCDTTCNTCIGPGPYNCISCKTNDVFWIGKCMSPNIYEEFLRSICIRIVCYLCLIIIIVYIFNKSIFVGSLILLIVSIAIFYFEQFSKINLAYIINYYYKVNIS